MKKIKKIEVTANGLLQAVMKRVSQWEPPKQKNEIAYRNHLLEVLRPLLPSDARIEKEYRHRGTTMDLWLEWKGLLFSDDLSFELKVNLTRKTDCDRLIGQIEGLEPKNNKILIILIGETENSLLKRIQEKYHDFLDESEQSMGIVLVGQVVGNA
ncbi:MAG: hypothetical protein ABW118_14965 [Candidatus Thiodiazotropha sp.]